MKQLSKIKKLGLRDVWAHEAVEFTPWLGHNLAELGEALGMDLELKSMEAEVGSFSLDILAQELGTGRTVIIENQLTATDHDHMGKLLTYAAGYDAAVVIWVAESFRDEHRSALDWLNNRTNPDTHFFGVMVEVLQIDDSRPAFHFNPVAFPNEWKKGKWASQPGVVSSRGEAYRTYFQPLIDELRETHRFTGARLAQPQSWYAFSSGVSGIHVSPAFGMDNMARVELYIDCGTQEDNKYIFDELEAQKQVIEAQIGFALQWDRLDDKRASRVIVTRPGSIESSPAELDQIRRWQIEKLLVFKRVFAPLVRAGVDMRRRQ